jgi:uncharacterized membrane protein
MLYPLLVWLHVVAAAIAVGTNVTYGVWMVRVRKAPAALPFTLATVKILDDRMANLAYGVVAITGVLLVWLDPFSFATPWVAASTVLFVVVGALGFGVYTPTLKAQVVLAEAGRADTPEFAALAQRGAVVGPILGVLVITILFLMVVQPSLWG